MSQNVWCRVEKTRVDLAQACGLWASSHWNWVLSWFETWISCQPTLHQEFHELTKWLQCKISRWDSTSVDFQRPDGIGAIGAKLKTYGLGGLGGLPLYPLYPLYHGALSITVICIFWFGKDPKAKLGLNGADLSNHVPLCLERKAQFATMQMDRISQASVDDARISWPDWKTCS